MLLTVGLRETCPNMSPLNQAEMPRLCATLPDLEVLFMKRPSLRVHAAYCPVRLPGGTVPFLYAVIRPKIQKTDYLSPSTPPSDTYERSSRRGGVERSGSSSS